MTSGTPAPAIQSCPRQARAINCRTNPESTHAPASGGKPTTRHSTRPNSPHLPSQRQAVIPVAYASLQAADTAMGKQRDEAKAAAFNQSRSAFSRIHKSTAPDARSGTGNAHALRNLGDAWPLPSWATVHARAKARACPQKHRLSCRVWCKPQGLTGHPVN